MKNEISSKNTLVELAVRGDCPECDLIESQLKYLGEATGRFRMRIYNLDRDKNIPNTRCSSITPAIWIAGKLFYLGAVDPNRFMEKIDQIQMNNSIVNNHKRRLKWNN